MTVTPSLPKAPRPDTRESRALALFRTRRQDIVLTGRNTYAVPSQDGTRVYTVTYGHDADETCTCADRTYRHFACVHLLAVAVCRAKRRGATVRKLAELEERYNHEDLLMEERLELRETIVRLSRKLGL
jgi:hypothetical protein